MICEEVRKHLAPWAEGERIVSPMIIKGHVLQTRDRQDNVQAGERAGNFYAPVLIKHTVARLAGACSVRSCTIFLALTKCMAICACAPQLS